MDDHSVDKARRLGDLRHHVPMNNHRIKPGKVVPDCRYCGGDLPREGHKCLKCGALIAGRK